MLDEFGDQFGSSPESSRVNLVAFLARQIDASPGLAPALGLAPGTREKLMAAVSDR